MVEARYIWCRNCNEVHHMTQFDKAPRHRFEGGEQIELPMDDRRAFLQRHSGHRLEGLQGIGERHFADGEAPNPMGVGYVEVTNGEESFVLRSSRNRIEDPLHFELIRGRLKAVHGTVSIRENEIRKEMKRHFPWRASERLDDEKIELFIRLFGEIVKELDPRHVDPGGCDDGAGSVACGVLSPATVDRLMRKCRTYFDPESLAGLKRFVEAHRDKDGVLTLRLVKQYEIEQRLA